MKPWKRVLLFGWWLGMGFLFYHDPSRSFRWSLALQVIPDPFGMTARQFGKLALLLLECGWLAFLGVSIGRLELEWLGLPWTGDAEALGFGLALGWGSLALGMAVLGLLKLWYKGLVYPALGVLTLAAGAAAWKGKALPTAEPKKDEPWSRTELVLVVLLLGFLAVNILGSLMPEVFYDALSCHLELPDLYWRAHGFYPVPFNIFSGIPLLIQMLFAVALPVGGPELAHLVHLTLGIGCVLLVYGFCRRFLGRRAGLVAALLLYSTPLIGVLSWKSAVDLGATLFQVASVYALVLALTQSERERAWLSASALLLGLTMGTKYQAWPLSLVLFAVLVFHPRTRQARVLARYVLLAVAAFFIWPLRNCLLYRNPVFPFYQEWFGSVGAALHWRAMLQDGGRDPVQLLTTLSGWKTLLLSPWQLSTQQYDTRSFGPVFLLGLPLLVLPRFEGKAERVLLAVTVPLFFAWALTNWVPRYFLPTFALAAALFGLGLESELSGKERNIAHGLVALVAFVNFFWTLAWFHVYNADPVVLGREAAASYLSVGQPSYGAPYYTCAQYANHNLPADARLLLLGEERGYYIERDYVAATAFVEPVFEGYLRRSATAAALRDALVRDGFTHILLNGAKFAVPDSAVYKDFAGRYLKAAFEDVRPPSVACGVYEIVRAHAADTAWRKKTASLGKIPMENVPRSD